MFLGGAIAAPMIEAAGYSAGHWLRWLYAPTCHQMAERSLTVSGLPMAVCARCTGLYAGGVVGLFLAAALAIGADSRLRRWWLFAAVAPSVVDFALPWIGLPGLPNVPRFLLAIPAGLMAALFLAVGLADLFAARPAPSSNHVASREPVEVLDV